MRSARLTFWITISALLVLSACGGAPQRAAMPDVASTDQSADDMGLPSAAAEPEASSAPEQPIESRLEETTPVECVAFVGNEPP